MKASVYQPEEERVVKSLLLTLALALSLFVGCGPVSETKVQLLENASHLGEGKGCATGYLGMEEEIFALSGRVVVQFNTKRAATRWGTNSSEETMVFRFQAPGEYDVRFESKCANAPKNFSVSVGDVPEACIQTFDSFQGIPWRFTMTIRRNGEAEVYQFDGSETRIVQTVKT